MEVSKNFLVALCAFTRIIEGEDVTSDKGDLVGDIESVRLLCFLSVRLTWMISVFVCTDVFMCVYPHTTADRHTGRELLSALSSRFFLLFLPLLCLSLLCQLIVQLKLELGL